MKCFFKEFTMSISIFVLILIFICAIVFVFSSGIIGAIMILEGKYLFGSLFLLLFILAGSTVVYSEISSPFKK